MATTLHQEKQRYHDWFTLSLLSLAAVTLLYGSASYFWRSDITALGSLGRLAIAGALAYAVYWIVGLRAKLKVTNKKIEFRIKGACDVSKRLSWKNVASVHVVRAARFGKWQRPKATLSDERYYSLAGRNGLLVAMKNGDVYFIGSQRVDELCAALHGEEKLAGLLA